MTGTFPIIRPAVLEVCQGFYRLCCEIATVASWTPARGKQRPGILFDYTGPETVLRAACDIFPTMHSPATGEAQTDFLTSHAASHGVKPSLTFDTIPADDRQQARRPGESLRIRLIGAGAGVARATSASTGRSAITRATCIRNRISTCSASHTRVSGRAFTSRDGQRLMTRLTPAGAVVWVIPGHASQHNTFRTTRSPAAQPLDPHGGCHNNRPNGQAMPNFHDCHAYIYRRK